jgi:CO dehydrogenase/acetyl-CoA synthase epsilon subunit
LKRVEYSSKLVSRKNLSTQETASRLYVKDKKWSSEIEVRAVYDDCNHDDSLWSKDDDGKTFFKVDIKAVSFGCMAENKEREYIKALQALKTFNQNHKKQIAVKKYTLSTTKFAFVLDKEFNYLEELKKLTDRTLCST